MEATPHPDALQNYLTALRERATQEIEARKPVELESQDTPQVVPPLIDVTITVSPTTPDNAPDTPWETSSPRIFPSLAEAFSHHAGRLVLLGRPGSGKTTTLWMFARERTEACLADPNQPLPIFLKIDTWNRKRPIAEWVLSQMPDLPLQNVPLLYLCDGLDELGGERPVDLTKPEGERFDPRFDFLRLAEAQFAESQFVISCRSAEYEQIRTKMHGCGAVTLLPLHDEKIEEFLTSWDRPHLWAKLINDPNLMELARTPLLLSLLTSAVGADGIDAEQDLRSLNESTLFRYYFDRRFTHEERKFHAQKPDQSLSFDKAATRQLLGKLALYMWHWPHDPLTTLDRIEAQFHLGTQADAFLDFACRMHFLRESPDGHIAFIHLKFRDFCVAPALQQTLENGSNAAREATFDILVQLKEQGVAPLLQAAEQSTSAVQREACAHLADLARLTEPVARATLIQSIPRLQSLLQNRDDGVRAPVISVLVCLGASAVPALLQALQDEDITLRYSTASVFAHVSPRIAPEFHPVLELVIPTLIEALQNNDRRKGTRSLATAALAELAKHTDPFYFPSRRDHYSRRWLTSVEADVDPPQGPPSPDGLPTNPTDPWLCEALAPTIPPLVATLHESDPQIHQNLVAALHRQRKRALPYLLSALKDRDPAIRSAAISLLTKSTSQADPAVQATFLQSVPALLQDLDSKESGVRRTAVTDLAELYWPTKQTKSVIQEVFRQAVPGLLRVLYERDKEARLKAAYLLSRLDVPVVSVLLQDLERGETRVRRRAAAILIQLSTESVFVHRIELKQSIPALLHALRHIDRRVRNSVIAILTRLSLPIAYYHRTIGEEKRVEITQGVSELLQAVRHSDRRVRRAAVLILAQFGEQGHSALLEVREEVIPILLEVLQHSHETIRRTARSAIKRLASQEEPAFQADFVIAVPAFLRKIKRKWVETWRDAASALAALGPPIVPVLIQALQEEDYRVRQLAVIVLARLARSPQEADRLSEAPAPSAYDLLLQALDDCEPRVRARVADELSSFAAEAIPPLLQALQDREARVRQEAVSSLASLGAVAVPALLQPLLEGETQVRRAVSSALLKTQDYADASRFGTRRSDAALREALLQAVPALRQALQDSEADVRRQILPLLVRLEEQNEPLLLKMLEDEALPVRRYAIDHLTYRRTTIPALLRLLQADRYTTRWAAVMALYEHGYVPRLALRPRLHIALRHRLGVKGRSLDRWLLARLSETPFLQRIPIHPSEGEE